jgi:hypothetical protein
MNSIDNPMQNPARFAPVFADIMLPSMKGSTL